MRRYTRYIVVAAVLAMTLSACGKNDKDGKDVAKITPSISTNDNNNLGNETDPTLDLLGNNDQDEKEGQDGTLVVDELPADDGTAQSTPKPVKERATEMYVKLNDYGSVMKIRSGAGTDTEAIGILVHAEKLDVIEIEGDWAKFFYKDGFGYCMTKYLVEQKPEYLTPPPVPTKAPEATKAPVVETEEKLNDEGGELVEEDFEEDEAFTDEEAEDTAGLTQEMIDDMNQTPPEI